MNGYLLDTSVFIAREQRRPVDPPEPGPLRVSVATLTELKMGVRRSANGGDRRVRERTMRMAHNFIPLAYDERVGDRLAAILAKARTERRRADAMDAIIAATALAHDLTVWTQDGDFDVLRELIPALRVHRG
jgi:hypothetical protein